MLVVLPVLFSSPMLAVTYLCLLPLLCSLNYSGMCLASDAQFSDFLDGMGPAQFVGRQTLATTSMGEEALACSRSVRLSSQRESVLIVPVVFPLVQVTWRSA